MHTLHRAAVVFEALSLPLMDPFVLNTAFFFLSLPFVVDDVGVVQPGAEWS